MINSDLTSLFKYLKKYYTLSKEAEKAIAEISKTISIQKNADLQSIGHTCKTIYFLKKGVFCTNLLFQRGY